MPLLVSRDGVIYLDFHQNALVIPAFVAEPVTQLKVFWTCESHIPKKFQKSCRFCPVSMPGPCTLRWFVPQVRTALGTVVWH